MTTRTGVVLCRLEAVHRAAVRLDTVRDRWRCRTRKVEPGNEPEGGRAQAGIFCKRPLLRFAAMTTKRHRASGQRRLLTKSAAKRARASDWAARYFRKGNFFTGRQGRVICAFSILVPDGV